MGPLDLLVLARTILLMEVTVGMLDAKFSLLEALISHSRHVLRVVWYTVRLIRAIGKGL